MKQKLEGRFQTKKVLILAGLPILSNVLLGLAGSYPLYKCWLILGSIIISIVYLFFLVHYNNKDNEAREKIESLTDVVEKLNNEKIVYEKTKIEVQALVQTIAEMFAMHGATSNSNVMDYDEMCNRCCERVYSVIESMGFKNLNCSVSYDTLIKKGNIKYVKLNAYHNTEAASPKVYKEERRLSSNKYYDLKLFVKNNSNYEILKNRSSICEKFCIDNPESSKKYNQYIGIPVTDYDNNVVGLLQIIAFGDTSFGETEDQIKAVAVSYFRPFISVLLLLYQINNRFKESKGEANE